MIIKKGNCVKFSTQWGGEMEKIFFYKKGIGYLIISVSGTNKDNERFLLWWQDGGYPCLEDLIGLDWPEACEKSLHKKV